MKKEKEIPFISLKEASRISGYHPDYLGYLIRKGKIEGTKIGKNWVTTKEAVFKYLSKKNKVTEEERQISRNRHFRRDFLKGFSFLVSVFLIFLLFVGGILYFSSKKDFSNQRKNSYLLSSQNENHREQGLFEVENQNSPETISQFKLTIYSLLKKEKDLVNTSVKDLRY